MLLEVSISMTICVGFSASPLMIAGGIDLRIIGFDTGIWSRDYEREVVEQSKRHERGDILRFYHLTIPPANESTIRKGGFKLHPL